MIKTALIALALTAAAVTGVAAQDYGYVAEGVDFHSGPSPKFYQFGDFQACTKIMIEEESPGEGPKWYRVSWDGNYGWVRADDIKYEDDYCETYDDEEKPTTSY